MMSKTNVNDINNDIYINVPFAPSSKGPKNMSYQFMHYFLFGKIFHKPNLFYNCVFFCTLQFSQ